jgi:hypothetical protein
VYVCEKSTQRSTRTGKPLTGSTMANHLGLLRRMLKVAHRWELITKLPEVILPRKGSAEHYLTRRETRDLLDKVDPLFRDLVLLAVRTGMRLGSFVRCGSATLTCGREDPGQAATTQRGKVKAPKGDKARTVQVPADAVAVLRCRVSGLDRDDLVFSKPAGYLVGHRNGEPAQGGQPWSPQGHHQRSSAVRPRRVARCSTPRVPPSRPTPALAPCKWSAGLQPADAEDVVASRCAPRVLLMCSQPADAAATTHHQTARNGRTKP